MLLGKLNHSIDILKHFSRISPSFSVHSNSNISSFFILSYRPLFEFGIRSDTQHIRRPDFHEFSRRMLEVSCKIKIEANLIISNLMQAEYPTFQIQFDINFIGDNSIAMNTPIGLNVTTSSSDAGSGIDDEEDTGGQVFVNQEDDSAELTSSMSPSLNDDDEPIVISDDEDELAAQHKEDSNEEEVHTVKLNPLVRNSAFITNLFVMLLLL